MRNVLRCDGEMRRLAEGPGHQEHSPPVAQLSRSCQRLCRTKWPCMCPSCSGFLFCLHSFPRVLFCRFKTSNKQYPATSPRGKLTKVQSPSSHPPKAPFLRVKSRALFPATATIDLHRQALRKQQVVSVGEVPQGQGFPLPPPLQPSSKRCGLCSGPVTKRLPPCPELPAALQDVGRGYSYQTLRFLEDCMSYCQASASQSVVKIT